MKLLDRILRAAEAIDAAAQDAARQMEHNAALGYRSSFTPQERAEAARSTRHEAPRTESHTIGAHEARMQHVHVEIGTHRIEDMMAASNPQWAEAIRYPAVSDDKQYQIEHGCY